MQSPSEMADRHASFAPIAKRLIKRGFIKEKCASAGGDWCCAPSYSWGIVACRTSVSVTLATNLLPGYNTLLLISIGSNRTRVERLVSFGQGEGRGGVMHDVSIWRGWHCSGKSVSICAFEGFAFLLSQKICIVFDRPYISLADFLWGLSTAAEPYCGSTSRCHMS